MTELELPSTLTNKHYSWGEGKSHCWNPVYTHRCCKEVEFSVVCYSWMSSASRIRFQCCNTENTSEWKQHVTMQKNSTRHVSIGSIWDATIWDSTNKKWSRILSTWNKQQWSRSLVVWSNNGAVTYSLKRKKKFKISTTDSVQLQTTAVEPILENSVVDYHNRIWDWTVCGMHIE